MFSMEIKVECTVDTRASFSARNSFVSLRMNSSKRSPRRSNRRAVDGASVTPILPPEGFPCSSTSVVLGSRILLMRFL